MRRHVFLPAIIVGLMLMFGSIPTAHSGAPEHEGPGHSGHGEGASEAPQGGHGGMMHRRMMRGMHGRAAMMGMHRPGQLLQRLKAELGLSDDQVAKLRPIVVETMKTAIRDGANLHVAEIDLEEMLDADAVDLAKVESQLKTVEGLRTTLRLNMIKAHERGKALLTPDQRQKFKSLHERMHGMMGMMGGMSHMMHHAADMPMPMTEEPGMGRHESH